jgi:cyclophilin family peptidyl-prolyl cis-trans isomerase
MRTDPAVGSLSVNAVGGLLFQERFMIQRRFGSAFIAVLVFCLGTAAVADDAKPKERKRYTEPPKMTIDAAKKYVATIETSKGKIVCELFPKEAPETVNSFVFLAREGYFDGLTFHRVEGWVIQGGDPTGTSGGGPGYQIKNEAKTNTHTHEAGTLAMARTPDPDSAGSQFYFTKQAAPGLDGAYTIFGKATEGLEIINKIEIGDVMKTITIEEK